jgi:hypothetical protein
MKSECSEYQKLIASSLIGNLDEEEQKDLDRHLAACPICRAEQAKYELALNRLKQASDEPVPRHFFVYPAEKKSNLCQVFQQMRQRWQALTVAMAALCLFFGVASVSRLQVRIDGGNFKIGFGESIDVVALKKDILKEAEAKSIQQRAEFIAELARLDSRLSRQISLAENKTRVDAQKSMGDLYRIVSQQRVQDLGLINYHFVNFETKDAIKTQQTDEILSTLLQEAKLRLNRRGEQQ